MRTRTALIAMAMVFGLGWSANRVFSQDGGMEGKKPDAKAEEKPAPAGPTPEEMAAWEKAMTPGEPHKKMAAREGTWDTSSKFWMAPGAPPTESKGTAKFRMIFGGRYQVQEYTGDMMGMPFEGMSIGGYDNVKQQYFSTWIDSMGTGAMNSQGTADEKGVITERGLMADPATGKDCKMRMVLTEKDKDTMFFEMFVDDGKGKGEMKCMELTYTRKK
jgi:hypothetical protein